MTRRVPAGPAVAALLLLGSGACGGTLATVSAARVESPVWGAEARPAAVQVAPSVAWRSGPAALAANASYAPTLRLESGIAPLARHRLAAEAGSARTAGLHPYGRASLDYGSVRPGDLVAEGFTEPLPQTDLLKSYAVAAEGGVTGRPGRRSLLRAGASMDHSAGLGTSASTLPALTRSRLFVRGEQQRSRDLRLDGSVQFTRYTMESTALLVESEGRATLRVSRNLSLATSAGGAAARTPGGGGSFRPLGGASAAWEAPRGVGGRLSVATRPDFDRQDGGLRQRLLAQGGGQIALVRGVRLGTSLNWLADVGGTGPRRRLLTADATLSVELPGEVDAALGARLLRQGGELAPGAVDPSEARLSLGVSRRLSIR